LPRTRTIFFLGGDSYPGDRATEDGLRQALKGPHTTFITHGEVFNSASNTAGPGRIDAKAKVLEQAIRDCGPGRDVFLTGRSAGARAITMAAQHCLVTAIACVSYPFRRPRRLLETKRFGHLRTLETPTLLLQGADDDYGGLEITEHYQFSPAIRLKFIPGNHNIDVTAAEGAAIVPQMAAFIEGGWRETGRELEGFDEDLYRATYPEVAELIAAGQFASGEDHFRKSGRKECRMYRIRYEGEV
jgi:dienelactone hydrolase